MPKTTPKYTEKHNIRLTKEQDAHVRAGAEHYGTSVIDFIRSLVHSDMRSATSYGKEKRGQRSK